MLYVPIYDFILFLTYPPWIIIEYKEYSKILLHSKSTVATFFELSHNTNAIEFELKDSEVKRFWRFIFLIGNNNDIELLQLQVY